VLHLEALRDGIHIFELLNVVAAYGENPEVLKSTQVCDFIYRIGRKGKMLAGFEAGKRRRVHLGDRRDHEVKLDLVATAV